MTQSYLIDLNQKYVFWHNNSSIKVKAQLTPKIPKKIHRPEKRQKFSAIY